MIVNKTNNDINLRTDKNKIDSTIEDNIDNLLDVLFSGISIYDLYDGNIVLTGIAKGAFYDDKECNTILVNMNEPGKDEMEKKHVEYFYDQLFHSEMKVKEI